MNHSEPWRILTNLSRLGAPPNVSEALIRHHVVGSTMSRLVGWWVEPPKHVEVAVLTSSQYLGHGDISANYVALVDNYLPQVNRLYHYSSTNFCPKYIVPGCWAGMTHIWDDASAWNSCLHGPPALISPDLVSEWECYHLLDPRWTLEASETQDWFVQRYCGHDASIA